jgi:26S proteasome regulatory subunit N9
VLQACADGNVTAFQELTTRHADAIQRQPALVPRASAVQEKLALLTLVRTAFGKGAHERTLTFEELATSIHVPVDQVEMLVMRALSVGLIKGSMDQVDGTLQVTWVLPRSLNSEQLQDLATRYGEWAAKVSRTKETVQEQAPAFA